MKLHTTTTLLQSAGVMERAQATVKMNAVAFKILSSGLYSDKLGAVLREIGCNAADAHIMVGKPDLPFQVTLPGALDPTFAIKDWGPGLSHEDVMTNYQTYFHSTKSNDDSVTGCFGLGSKAPYAYTDQFTVKSAHNGVLRTYFCAFDEAGVPTTSLVSESPVSDDWPHGLEVSLPVRYADQNELVTKAHSVFKWFRVPPKIVGGAQIQPIEYEWTVGRFRKVKDRYRAGVFSPQLVMGNVAYAFNTSAFTTPDTSWQNGLMHWMRAQEIVFEVPIGTVDVTASRETVEYTPRSIEALTKLFDEELTSLATTINEFFEARPQLTTAAMNGLIDELANGGNFEVIRPLREIFAERIDPKYAEAFDATLTGEVEVKGWWPLLEDLEAAGQPKMYGTLWYWDGDRRRSRFFTGMLPVDNRTIVLLNDRPTRATDRITALMREDKTKQVLVFSHASPDGWKRMIPVFETNDVPVDCRLVSSLPKPAPKVKGAASNRRTGDAKELDAYQPDWTPAHSAVSGYGYEPPSLAIKEFPDDSRFYVVREAGGWGKRWLNAPHGRIKRPNEMWDALRILEAEGFDVPTHVAVVTESMLTKGDLETKHGFQNLSVWYREFLTDQRVIDFRTEARTQTSVQMSSWGNDYLTHHLFRLRINKKPTWTEMAKALSGTTYLAELEALAVEYEVTAAKVEAERNRVEPAYYSALRVFGLHQPSKNESFNFDSKIKKLHEAYPKLRALASEPIYSADTFKFQMLALAMAVSPEAPVVIATAEETT